MVVREPLCASALVECGFLSNREEEASLQLSAYQQLIAAGIADGVQSYLTNPDPDRFLLPLWELFLFPWGLKASPVRLIGVLSPIYFQICVVILFGMAIIGLE